MRFKRRRLIWWSVSIFVAGSVVWASTKPQGPISVDADKGTFDLKAKAHHFQGHVRLVQADFSIEAEQAWVEGESGHIKVRAEGHPVRLAWPTEHIKASALHVEYQQSTGEVNLSGQVYLDQKGNVLESDHVRYSLVTRSAIADGGQHSSSPVNGRVHMHWLPEESSGKGDTKDLHPSPIPVLPPKAKAAGSL